MRGSLSKESKIKCNDADKGFKAKRQSEISLNFTTNFFKMEQSFNWKFTIICQEIRFQIDEQRERLKQKIDDIVLGLRNETRKYESMYLNNLQREMSLRLGLSESKSNKILFYYQRIKMNLFLIQKVK